MPHIPTLAEEDARRPNRERENLVGQRTRIVNRMKAGLVRFGIRAFKPASRKASDRLATLNTPEGTPLPPNTLAEMRRDMARLRFVIDQIKEIEAARLKQLEQAPKEGPQAMLRLLARGIGVGIDPSTSLTRRTCWYTKSCRATCGIKERWRVTPVAQARRTRAAKKAGNARVRRGMLQLAWRFLRFQKDSALAQWQRAVTKDARGSIRKTMTVARARKLLIALWRMATIGQMPENVALRAA